MAPLPESVSFGQALVYLVNFWLVPRPLHAWSKAREAAPCRRDSAHRVLRLAAGPSPETFEAIPP
jgi:hypothetical protein